MRVESTSLPGCVILKRDVICDERGRFIKIFRADEFAAIGLPVVYAEEYFSVSRERVLRGMHLQTPPHEHFKLVCCLAGRIRDVLVDLRVGSPQFGSHFSVDLDASSGCVVAIPPGVAHGFCVLGGDAVVAYKVTSPYAPENDTGVRWNSFGCSWPLEDPMVSQRDSLLPSLRDFRSPFLFEQPGV